MMELSQRRSMVNPQARIAARNRQSRKLMIALGLLLAALVAVLIHDRQFWFGGEQATIESDMPATQPVAQTAAPAVTPAKPALVSTARKPISAPKVEANPAPAEAPAVATTRTALPPLDVEVVAGSKHSEIHPPAPAKVDVPPSSLSASSIQPVTEAAQREPIQTVAAIQAPQASFRAYPVLAQHMNVQGSVVLQAVISADGLI